MDCPASDREWGLPETARCKMTWQGPTMGNKEPLDMSRYKEYEYVDDCDVDYQVEIVKDSPKVGTPEVSPRLEIPAYPNPKFTEMADHIVEESIIKYQGYLRDLNVKNKEKLVTMIKDLEMEKLFRKTLYTEGGVKRKGKAKPKRVSKDTFRNFSRNGDDGRPTSTHTNYRDLTEVYEQTDCSGRDSKLNAADSPPYSEEIVVVNPSKGKRPCTQRIPNSDSLTFDGGKASSRVSSGNLAGPSPRLGLRSSPKCQTCKEPACVCMFSAKGGPNFTDKESPKRNSAPEPTRGRRGTGTKRARQDVDGDSPEKVVEICSSEDEDDKEAKGPNADGPTASQRRPYGTRSSLLPSLQGLRIAYPSRDDPASVEVASHDLARLAPLEFLNDTVIDFYIKYMQRPGNLSDEDRRRFYFFNSFFYKKLSDVVSGQNKKTVADLSKMKRWTKGTNIFEKEYLFVPIHDKWHWSLAIVCHPGATSEDTGCDRSILHLDSMCPGHKSNTVFRLLRTYLVAESEHQAEREGQGSSFQKLSSDDFAVKKIPVPQQENESDCGLFLLHYIELFLRVAPPAFTFNQVDEGTLFGRSWFKPYQASDLRRVIKDLLVNFFEEEASRAKLNTQTIERSSENNGSESRLQSDGHLIHPSDAEVVKSADSPTRSSSPTELVHEQDRLDTNIEASTNHSTPKAVPSEYAEQGVSKELVQIEDTPVYSQANCSDPRKSSEKLTAPTLGSSGGSDDNATNMTISPQCSKGIEILEDDDQREMSLIVDLSPQE